jgi:hypothetical protein
MAIRRGLAISLSGLVVVAFTLISAAVTASAQGFKPAGNYSHTTMLGSFNYSDPATSTNISVFANRQRTVGPAGTIDETTIFLNVSANFFTFNVNCFLDDNSNDFTVASNVSSAAIHKTIATDNPGCGGGLTSDLALDVSWTGAGPVQSTNTTSQFMCSGYTDESQGNDSNNAGPATFNITGLDSPVSAPDPQVFHFGSSLEHAQGALPPDSCSGGVGRGAGRPTPAAGNYHTTFQTANANFSSSDGTTSLGLFVGATSSTSNPLSGPSTSSSETDLQFNLFNFSTGGSGGCFKINGSDFALSATTASLHTSLSAGTPSCDGTNTLLQDPFPIDITWTGTSPAATTRANSQYSCLGYHFQTSTVQVVDNVADANISMPGLSTVVQNAGPIGSIDTRTHADGTPAPGCFFRG